MSKLIWKQLVFHRQEFNLENTLVNGQCFNWRKLGEDHFEGVFSEYYVQVKRTHDDYIEYCTIPDHTIKTAQIQPQDADKKTKKIGKIEEEKKARSQPEEEEKSSNQNQDKFLDQFKAYINYDIKVLDLYDQWAKRDKRFSQIAEPIHGVRCLRQDPWECTCNNIKRITQMLDTLRQKYGTKICEIDQNDGSKKSIYKFPTIEQMSQVSEKESKYLVANAKMMNEKVNISHRFIIREQLITLNGIGNKVADCIALFSLDCANSIPVDTHVFQIAQKLGYVQGMKKDANLNQKLYMQIVEAFRDRFGDKAGWAHQIMFAGDLKSFQEKINNSKKRKLDEISDQNAQNNEQNMSEKIKVDAGHDAIIENNEKQLKQEKSKRVRRNK